jgi:release factor glutamine methyltransferase
MTLTQALTALRDSFTPVSGAFALPEAERVLTFLLNCSRSHLYLTGATELPPATAHRIDGIIRRRSTDEPLAYILGSAYFYNREFVVSPEVLIPRPDTEILVEEVLKRETGDGRSFIDLGTGSGCIATVLAEQNPSWHGVAIDLSPNTLLIARRNSRNGFSLVCGDRLSAIRERQVFDFIVSNPPYIQSSALPLLQKSVRDFEPLSALDGGPDGLDFYRYLAIEAGPLLKRSGRIYCEIGFDQGEAAATTFAEQGWTNVKVTKDLGGHPRVVQAIAPVS